MLNQSGITKTSGVNVRQILANVELQYSVGCVVSASAGVMVGSKKIVKAGTPLAGNLDSRETPFIGASTDPAVGVLLHDVDVTAGNANATLLIFGFVNTNQLEDDVKAKITAGVKTNLNAKVTFLAL